MAVKGKRVGKVKLKPCPWCGRKPKFVRVEDSRWYYHFGCKFKHCDTRPEIRWIRNKEDAIKAWNKRFNEKA